MGEVGEEKWSLAPSEVVPGYCVLYYYSTTTTNKQTNKQTKNSVVFGYYKNLKQNVNEDLKRTKMTT